MTQRTKQNSMLVLLSHGCIPTTVSTKFILKAGCVPAEV